MKTMMRSFVLGAIVTLSLARGHHHDGKGKHGGKGNYHHGHGGGPPRDPIEDMMESCQYERDELCPEEVETGNLVVGLACAQKHADSLSAGCQASIDRHYPALFMCADEVRSFCPTVGSMEEHFKGSDMEWDNDDDEWKKDGDRDGRGGDREGPSPRRQKPGEEGTRCLNAAMNKNKFSSNCTSAIEQQWTHTKVELGLPQDFEPMASDVYVMFSPPLPDLSWGHMKFWAIGLATTAGLSLCCCAVFFVIVVYQCCKARRAATRVGIVNSPQVLDNYEPSQQLSYTGVGQYAPPADAPPYAVPMATMGGAVPVATPV